MTIRTLPLALACGLLSACPPSTPDGGSDPDGGPVDEDLLYTPRWAFRPWISKDISNRADTEAFVAGFQSRDIPVGAVVLDSPWETHYNTFVPNEDRYPDLAGLIDDLHDDDIRLVLWVTQMVNSESYDLEPGGDTYAGESPNFREGARAGYFVNDAETFFWWKGQGAALDFFNADARAWWHAQQDALLDAGLDGWKLDFGEQYITTDPVTTSEGDTPLQEYSERYYEDFLDYGREKRGRDFVTMVRAYDESYGFAPRFYARPEHAPVAWMGDNYQNDEGLADALDHAFRSAAAGYVVVGSDIGGYLDRRVNDEIPFSVDVFMRWTAMSTFMPFFQLHGRANITPWTVPERVDEVVAVYRAAASTHDAMVPFFYSLAVESYAGARSGILTPVGELAAWAGDYRFLVGDALFVAPLLDGAGARDVVIPDGAGRVRPLFALAAAPLDDGAARVDEAPPPGFPVLAYLREGAIVPARPSNDATPFPYLDGHDVVLVWPGASSSTFRRHDDDDAVTTITASTDADGATITLSRAPSPSLVVVVGRTAPAEVTVDDNPATRVDSVGGLAGSVAVTHDAQRALEIVRVDAGADEIRVRIAGDGAGI